MQIVVQDFVRPVLPQLPVLGIGDGKDRRRDWLARKPASRLLCVLDAGDRSGALASLPAAAHSSCTPLRGLLCIFQEETL